MCLPRARGSIRTSAGAVDAPLIKIRITADRGIDPTTRALTSEGDQCFDENETGHWGKHGCKLPRRDNIHGEENGEVVTGSWGKWMQKQCLMRTEFQLGG